MSVRTSPNRDTQRHPPLLSVTRPIRPGGTRSGRAYRDARTKVRQGSAHPERASPLLTRTDCVNSLLQAGKSIIAEGASRLGRSIRMGSLSSLRSALQVLWSESDRFVRRNLRAALALV